MTKVRAMFRCSSCQAEHGKWVGRCSRCALFGTVDEVRLGSSVGVRTSLAKEPARPARRVADIDLTSQAERMSTGLKEFDRVLGGGIVAGQVLLLSGEPGCGKSTVLLTAADRIAKLQRRPVLYISGEESAHQLATRAQRIQADAEHLFFAETNDLAEVIGHLAEFGPELALVIVDSVQTIASASVDGRPGGVSQVMEVANALTRVAKGRDLPLFLVGQVTKESTVAGPKALEHVVDTTLTLEGDRQTALRLMRAVKNRFGAADEIACFEQTDAGMVEVADPSGLFRSHREQPIAGTCLTVTIEGRRPLLTEIQSLVAETKAPHPRRGVNGLDVSRVTMLIAVTERHSRVPLHQMDVYAATVGGMRSNDPGSDLAICLSLASAVTGMTLPLDVAAIGEVSLSGDIRRVAMLGQRINEAVRLGFQRILVPPGTNGAHPAKQENVTLIETDTIHAALRFLMDLHGGTK